jgi:ATP-dependent DNA helicase PIF1
MGHKYAFEAVDRTFRDLMGSLDKDMENVMFGGKVILLGGDFRQVLPVVPRSGRAEIVNACLKTSYIWKEVILRRLTINMRVETGENNADENMTYSEFLFNLGAGKIRREKNLLGTKDLIKIPEKVNVLQDKKKLVDTMFPNMEINYTNKDYLISRSLLTPKHEDVDDLDVKDEDVDK